MRGRAALVSVLTVGAVLALAPAASAQEVTTTTILPIFVPLHVSANSGPAGFEVTVSGGMCDEFRGGEFATVTFNDADQTVEVDGTGAWSTTVTIPADADVGDVFTIHALCGKSTSTVFRYGDATFTVAAPSPTSAVTTTPPVHDPGSTVTTATATTQTTITVIDVGQTVPATVGPTAQLPRTGANDSTGLIALAASLIGAGGMLLLSRRRPRGE